MPHAPMQQESTNSVATSAPACHDHADVQSATGAERGSRADVTKDSNPGSDHADTKDCCKSGGCKCPCAHLSVLVAPVVSAPTQSVHEIRASGPVAAPAIDRLNVLLRPPA
jgi:hypothetical protein